MARLISEAPDFVCTMVLAEIALGQIKALRLRDPVSSLPG
jgi:hypothetical protein